MGRDTLRSVLLAAFEVRHSRSIAPTRRVAVGSRVDLPTSPPPGFGGLLLAGVVGANIGGFDPDQFADLHHLIRDVEHGARIAQPRLRYRFQTDTHGLVRTRHRLVGRGQSLHLDHDEHDSPVAQVLAAVYALGSIPVPERHVVADLVRRALRWPGGESQGLMAFLAGTAGAGRDLRFVGDPHRWALEILGFAPGSRPASAEVRRRFRDRIRLAHPDHGGDARDAAQRVADLTEARRILS